MAITYGSQTGTQITTSVVGNTTLPTQVAATSLTFEIGGTAVTPSSATNYNGNIGTGTNGLGNTFVGRIVMIDPGGAAEQIRYITAESFAGSTITLTVNEAWTTQPTSSHNYYICYEPGDIEDGGEGGGINLNPKTGFYELSNDLRINNGGFLQIANGQALELDDAGDASSFFIQSGGYFIAGLVAAGAPIAGGVMPSYNGVTGEPSTQIQSGGNAYISDTLLYAQVVAQQYECAQGSNGNFNRVKWLNFSNELLLYDATVTDCSVAGKGSTTDFVRIDEGTTINGMVFSNIDSIDTDTGITGAETLTITDGLFVSVTDYIVIRDNKTWNMIDPIWDVTDHTDFDEANVTGTAEINDRSSVTATVQTADGTLLQDALVNIYTHEQSIDGGGATSVANLDLKLVSDANGLASGSFIYTGYNWSTGIGTNTVYSGHALQCGKWLYSPFVAAQSSSDKFSGFITLSLDPNIVQTTQATAKSEGTTAGVTWNEDTNSSSVIEFTSGSGTLSVGDTVTSTATGANGIVTQILSGDSTAGEVHLRARDTNAFTSTNAGDLTTGGGWSATLVGSSEQRFAIWIDAKNISLQALYDYLLAIQTETTLGATGELIWEWGRDQWGQALFKTGSDFYTERYNGAIAAEDKGVIVVNNSGGTVSGYTADDGTTWIPPAQYTFSITGLKDGTEVRLHRTDNGNLISGVEDVTGGVGTDMTNGVSISGTTDDNTFSYSYTYSTDIGFYAVILSLQYQILKVSNLTLTNLSNSIPVSQNFDRNYQNP